jgi:hypothetical protein
MTDLLAIADRLASETPQARLLWRAAVEIGERQGLGQSPHGERFIVPIQGGVFRGGPDHADLHGRVLPGGADRQLLRPDGLRELDALYEMQVHDGAVLTIRNRVLVDDTCQPRYARSVVQVRAPNGAWSWLNRRCLIGTLQPLRPAAQAVLVSVFALE